MKKIFFFSDSAHTMFVRTHVRGELAGADDLEEPDPALGAGHDLLPEQVPGAEVLVYLRSWYT